MKIKVIYFLIMVVSFFSFLLFNLIFLDRQYGQEADAPKVVVVKGDNLRRVAAKMESAGVISNRYIFIAAGKILGLEDKIIPGEYALGNGLTLPQMLHILTDPAMDRGYSVTIPEGLTIRQIARILSRQTGIDSAAFVKETKRDSLLNLLGVKADNLEGFLFPDTYRFNLNPSINREREIVRIMFDQFRKKIGGKILDSLKQRKMDLKSLITMASIVEGETRYLPEMKTIAGVYYNRLKKRMRLEADPTVQYSLPDGPKRRLTYNDLKYQSPYNTYLNPGLPPGPINNPGMAAIYAAMYPERHNYFYFVAKGDGTHVFAETYDVHKKNVEEYREFLENKQ